MDRRIFIRGLFASTTAMILTGCGGGSSGGGSVETQSVPPATTPPTPTPPPPPPPPPPVPTLNGVTIDQAEADIKRGLQSGLDWVARAVTPTSEVVVSNADQFQLAVTAAYDVARNPLALGQHHRIVLAWTGPSTLAAGPAARVTVGIANHTGNHLASGGSLTIAAAAGHRPSFANDVYFTGRGLRVQNVGFVRKRLAGENGLGVGAAYVATSQWFPSPAVIAFENCRFGAMTENSAEPWNSWINGVMMEGLTEFVAFTGCTFRGSQVGLSLVARGAYIDRCDFRSVLMDCIAMRGHVFATDYHAHAWVSRTTFRDAPQEWDVRSNHSDAVQSGTGADRHLGYRLLMTDNVVHLGRKFGGTNDLGGGTQGFFNNDHTTADNQFVVRRSIILSASPRAFQFYSPRCTRPSFIDACTVSRAGMTPSGFAPDVAQQDWGTGIAGSVVPAGTWVSITDSISQDLFETAGAQMDLVPVDVRPTASPSQRPEAVFVGRDFTRGGAAANAVAGKFGYLLPNEAGTQRAFVADLWANFAPRSVAVGKGWPDPSAHPWAS